MTPSAYAESLETGKRASQQGTGPGGILTVKYLEYAGVSPDILTGGKKKKNRK